MRVWGMSGCVPNMRYVKAPRARWNGLMPKVERLVGVEPTVDFAVHRTRGHLVNFHLLGGWELVLISGVPFGRIAPCHCFVEMTEERGSSSRAGGQIMCLGRKAMGMVCASVVTVMGVERKGKMVWE